MSMPSIAVLCSGGGSNLQALIDHAVTGELGARIAFVAGNNGGAFALERARRAGLPTFHVSSKTEGSDEGVARRLLELLREHDIRYLVLAGYMRQVPDAILDALPDRIINIHPALLPAFGGKGMYGHHVHEAVIARGAQWSGVTIHTVIRDYDSGPILWQRVVAVHPGDTPDALAARVLKVEHDSLWRVIRALCSGRLQVTGGQVKGEVR